ncbi:hypothetical protein D3C71_344320 [compost metagenome]
MPESLASNINTAFNIIVTLFGAGSLAWLVKSKRQKKIDNDTSVVAIGKEYLELIELATAAYKSETESLRTDVKGFSKELIELKIEVGILRKENERKDIEIQKKDEEIRTLKIENKMLIDRLKQFEAA